MDFNQAYEKIRNLEQKIEALEADKKELQEDIKSKINYNIKLRSEIIALEKATLKKITVLANQTGNKGIYMRIRWLFFGFDAKPFINLYR